MIQKRMFINVFILVFSIFILSIEKIKLAWEITTLHNNYANLRVENENLKDLNLKLITQFHIENSPANIEKIAKESLGMEKKKPIRILINE
jgi:cell division protein FtsL|tara:strand:- start:236 stop:508 length:273 start_codon:yes stop_codon:yes gene_type:complete